MSTISSCSTVNASSICPALTDTSTQYEKYWCEPGVTMSITCPTDTVINILCAFYGIDPNIRCPDVNYVGSPTACYSESSQTLVNTTCQGKQSCTLSGTTSFASDSGFSNVCSGYQNMLYVQWECVTSTATTTSTSTTTSTTYPYCSQSYIEPTGTCVSSSFSPYTPVRLTNSTSTYFSYPIYEQTICQNGKLIIACGNSMNQKHLEIEK